MLGFAEARPELRFDIGLVGQMDAAITASLEQDYIVHPLWKANQSPHEIPSDATAIVTDGHSGASASLIEALPNLRLIACYGVGVDAIDLEAARRRGVTITTTPGVLTDDVADMAVALLLAVSRQRHKSSSAYAYYDDLTSLARDVEFLIVTAPGGPAARGIVNREVLEALGRDGVLINVARGSIVDEPALVDALRTGRVAGAGLDVFAQEPHIPEELKAMSNVVLEPHQASGTVEAHTAMTQLVMQNLRAHFAGTPLISPLPNSA
jgi:lactate dehydrogenase-like 2-hydroxyacid dehydrogenase